MMQIPKDVWDNSRIVRSWAGAGTCETYFQTADGRVWRNDPNTPAHITDGTMITVVGRIVNGHIL